jgi:hypothetical protein
MGSRYGEPSGQNGSGDFGFSGLAVSRSIGEPLADNAANRARASLHVINAKPDPVAYRKSNSAR